MSLISPNFDVKFIIFSQFWPGAFSQNCWKKALEVESNMQANILPLHTHTLWTPGVGFFLKVVMPHIKFKRINRRIQ